MQSASRRRPPPTQHPAKSPRKRWLGLAAAWLLAALLIFLHLRAALDYVSLLDRLGSANGASARTPLQQVVPAHYSDAQMWARLVLDAGESHEARIRFTTSDNA